MTNAVVLTVLTISTVLLGTALLQLSPAAFAQSSITDFIYAACNTDIIARNDSFAELNLGNALYNSLTYSSSRVLYYSAISQSSTRGQSINFVEAKYQCRGDLSLSDCSICVTHALAEFGRKGYVSSVCGYLSTGVQQQYRGCFLRYEDYIFSGSVEIGMSVEFGSNIIPLINCTGSPNESSRLYRENLVTALKDSATAAPQHPQFGFNATSVGSGPNTAYVLTQCMGYLNSTQCAACLSQLASNYSSICNGSMSGEVYFGDCYYLFGNTSLVLTSDKVNNYISPAPGPVILPAPSQPPAPITNYISPAPSPVILPAPSQPPAPITNPLPDQGGQARNSTAAITGIVVGSLAFLAIIAALVLCFCQSQKKSRAEVLKEQGDHLLLEPGARRFSLKELQEATQNFHPAKKLGEGGFGPVYQGRLNSGREVAVKMLSCHSRQGKVQFVNEVNLITTVQHRNLIELIGYCKEDNKQLLVYEYLPNRSLDLCLFDVDKKSGLNWCTRFEIIVGIARGLKYLHEDSVIRIIHRDIKASNILLDKNLHPKISDFGLARLFGDDISHLTTRVVGTLGYLAPEYAIGGQLSEKADVYSFGLVVLEIVSGRRVVETNYEADKQNLLEWTWVLYEKHQQLQILDEMVQKEGKGLDGHESMHVNAGEVIRVVHVALLCTQMQPQARPSMSEVYNMLCGQSEILGIPTKPMTVGMLSPIAGLLPDSSSKMSSGSILLSKPSVKSIYSYDANPISQVEAR